MKEISRTILIILCINMSCIDGYKSTKITDEIYGTYIFQYPSNEIEILTINEDKSFNQKIYVNQESFMNKSKPLYSNVGEWSVSNEYELNFNNWLQYCYMLNPKEVLSQPNNIYLMDVSWTKPTSKHNGLILIYQENNFVFMNIKDWEFKKTR